MRRKISLWNKLKLFGEYKKIVKLSSVEIENIFGARVDNAYRIYNVLNIPEEPGLLASKTTFSTNKPSENVICKAVSADALEQQLKILEFFISD